MISPSTTISSKVSLCLALSVTAHAADLIVTNTADSGTGSLRDAIASAAGGDVILFDPALDDATIILTSGSLNISDLELTIDASGLPSGIVISGNNSSRIFYISGNLSEVTLSHLTLRDGREAASHGGGLFAAGGQLTMSGCTISDCYALYNGGGAYIGNGIVANLDRCSILGNQSGQFGGGVFLIGALSTAISNSVVAGNRSNSSDGGGISNLTDNPVLTNVTIQGNSGGGIRNFNSSSPILRNCIVWGNSFPSGTTAGAQLKNGSATSFDVDFSLIQGASGPTNFNDGNRVTWGTSNLDGNLAGNNPQFVAAVAAASAPSSLSDVRLLSGSTSINEGDSVAMALPVDRAGFPRIQGAAVDLGAYEGGYVTFSGLYPSILPGGDENQNGVSNFVEYALGVDPLGGGAFSAMPSVSSSGGFNFLTSNRRINGLDLSSSWVTSTSMEALSWQEMEQGVNFSLESSVIIGPGIQQLVFKILDGDPARFYRQRFLGN